MKASIFWDSQGMIMIDYLEQGRTVNGAYYEGKLKGLHQEIARKMQGKLTQCVLLLQDKAHAHTSQVVMTAATECGFEILPYPPYSPDMAPCDFYLIPKLKSHLPGTQYGSNDGVMDSMPAHFLEPWVWYPCILKKCCTLPKTWVPALIYKFLARVFFYLCVTFPWAANVCTIDLSLGL